VACEPSIGVNWNVGDGKTALYQASISATLRLIWDDSLGYPNQPPMTIEDETPGIPVPPASPEFARTPHGWRPPQL